MRSDYAGFNYITTATSTQVKIGQGVLVAIILNKPVASSTIKLIDGTSGSTANIATITNTTDVKPYMLFYGIQFTNGLRVVTSSTDDITVVYSGT